MIEVFQKQLKDYSLQPWRISVSDQFINCLNKQINILLEQKAGGVIICPVYVTLDEPQKNKPEIVYAAISCLEMGLFVNYSVFKIRLCWNADSGRIYKMDDADIDENDIRFWMEGIDDEKFKKMVSRIFTHYNKTDGQHPFFVTSNACLLRLHYGMEISDEFIICAGNQLAILFEKETGLHTNNQIRMQWDPGMEINCEKDPHSGIAANIWLPYGKVTATIAWRSSSGRIYQLSDTDIDCADLQFSFEGLDKDLCNHLFSPKWSLVTFPEQYREDILFQKNIPVPVSLAFIRCYNQQLTPIFENMAGFAADKNVALTINTDNEFHQEFHYTQGDVSRLGMTLYINHNWNKVNICWQSASGKIYHPGDTAIDCGDIKFWFEDFDALSYYKQMFPTLKLPFKLKDLSYELLLVRVNMDMVIAMKLKTTELSNATKITGAINDFIAGYNATSEKKERKYGVVHSWTCRLAAEKLIYKIDTGFTGARFLKNILQFLSGLNAFEQVDVL